MRVPGPLRTSARLAAAVLLPLLAGACADSTSPTEPHPLVAAAESPLFGVVASDGTYWDSFNFLTSTSGPFGTPTNPWPDHPPTPWHPTDFDVQIHSRDPNTWYAPEPFRAMHGTNCAPYQNAEPANDVRPGDTGSHAVSTYEELNYRCRNHMMTAIKATGYGVIYLTPNAMVDFGAREASVKFAVSTLRSSSRDWWDLWLTPYDDNLALPVDGSVAVGTDLQGPPPRAVHIRMAADPGKSRFDLYVVNNYGEGRMQVLTTKGYESILKPVSTRRDTFELRISSTRIRFGMKKVDSPDEPAGAINWIDVPVRLKWTRGVLQWGHHSQNPEADGGTAGTWHWDDFTIAPAVPFSIITSVAPAGGRVRYVDASTAATPVNFERPAPAGANLRFAAFGTGIQVSTDGGATWSDARVQPAALNRTDRFRSYWTPVPQGTSSVLFRQNPATPGTWIVQDMTIWSVNP